MQCGVSPAQPPVDPSLSRARSLLNIDPNHSKHLRSPKHPGHSSNFRAVPPQNFAVNDKNQHQERERTHQKISHSSALDRYSRFSFYSDTEDSLAPNNNPNHPNSMSLVNNSPIPPHNEELRGPGGGMGEDWDVYVITLITLASTQTSAPLYISLSMYTYIFIY